MDKEAVRQRLKASRDQAEAALTENVNKIMNALNQRKGKHVSMTLAASLFVSDLDDSIKNVNNGGDYIRINLDNSKHEIAILKETIENVYLEGENKDFEGSFLVIESRNECIVMY